MSAEALRLDINRPVRITKAYGDFVVSGRPDGTFSQYKSPEHLELKPGEIVLLHDDRVSLQMDGSAATASVKSGGNLVEVCGSLLTAMVYHGESVPATWGPIKLGETPKSELVYDVKDAGNVVFTIHMMGHNRRDAVQRVLRQPVESTVFPGVKEVEIIAASGPLSTLFVGLTENDLDFWRRTGTVNTLPSKFLGSGFLFLMAQKRPAPSVWVRLGLAVNAEDSRIRLYEVPQKLIDFSGERNWILFYKQLEALARISLLFKESVMSDGTFWIDRGGLPAQIVDVLSSFYHSYVVGGDYKRVFKNGTRYFKNTRGVDISRLLAKPDHLVVTEARRLRSVFDTVRRNSQSSHYG